MNILRFWKKLRAERRAVMTENQDLAIELTRLRIERAALRMGIDIPLKSRDEKSKNA